MFGGCRPIAKICVFFNFSEIYFGLSEIDKGQLGIDFELMLDLLGPEPDASRSRRSGAGFVLLSVMFYWYVGGGRG